MAAVLLSVEGVLAAAPTDPGALFPASLPVRPGIRLLEALGEHYKVVLATDEANPDFVEHWLKQQGLTDFYGVLVNRLKTEVDLDHTQLRCAQFARMRGSGFQVDFVVDTDPAVITHVMQQGFVGMLFAHPQYLRPEFRPDSERGQKTWAEIEAEQEHQAVLRSGDVRLDRPYEEIHDFEADDDEVITV
jgi:hypothetical protein